MFLCKNIKLEKKRFYKYGLTLRRACKRCSEDWIHSETCGWIPVVTWLPCRTCIPCVPLHAVHQTFRRTFLFTRTVSCGSVSFMLRLIRLSRVVFC